VTGNENLRNGLVIGRTRDELCEYGEITRKDLITPALSLLSQLRATMEYGGNPNLRRSWIGRYQHLHASAATATAQPNDDVIDIPKLIAVEAAALVFDPVAKPAAPLEPTVCRGKHARARLRTRTV
jgi:hypothetical protein